MREDVSAGVIRPHSATQIAPTRTCASWVWSRRDSRAHERTRLYQGEGGRKGLDRPKNRREVRANLSKRQISTGCLRLMAAKKKKSGLRGSPFGTVPEVMSVKESLLVAEASAALDHPLLAR